jgi:hypothetical protein
VKVSTFAKISDLAWDWLDELGYCSCEPRQDQCQVCKQQRALERQRQPKQPKVFTGQAEHKPRKLSW